MHRKHAPEIIELSDDELEAIPQDKRVKIVQAQIEGGRAELSELYEKLEEQKLSCSELEYKLREIHTKRHIRGLFNFLQYSFEYHRLL